MSKSFSRVLAVTTATLLMLLGQGTVAMAANEQSFQGEEVIANQLIVQLEKDAASAEEVFDNGSVLSYSALGLDGAGTYLVKVNPFDSLATNLSRIEAIDGVEFAEPNYEVELQNTSNDTRYASGEMWGMYGSTSSSTTSPTSSNGVNAAGAWAKGYTGSRAVYVAVIDSGINVSHSDLAANVWTNAQEIPGDGIDNDNNGFIDDIHGYDFLNNDGSVYDVNEHPHGTHVAGTIGAVGGNGLGVTGVAACAMSHRAVIEKYKDCQSLFIFEDDAEFDGDIKWKGRSLGDLLTTIEKRLAILTPDPEKLEHYESLQKAYQHYKTLEALCETPSKKEDK
jgi:subtilisin family serine protease